MLLWPPFFAARRAGNDAFAKKDLDEALRLYSEVGGLAVLLPVLLHRILQFDTFGCGGGGGC